MANFNDFEDVRRWVGQHGHAALATAVEQRTLSGKSLEVARAYLEAPAELQAGVAGEEEDDDPKWEWRPWRMALVAALLIGPPLIVWLIQATRAG